MDAKAISRCNFMRLPVLGTVAAGLPVLAEDNIEEYLNIPCDCECSLNTEDLFLLRVKGGSMIKAGIKPGDNLIVRQCNYAENGEIVIALLGNEATVKRFYLEKGHFRLQPENDSMVPIITDNVKILGKVIGLLRAL